MNPDSLAESSLNNSERVTEPRSRSNEQMIDNQAAVQKAQQPPVPASEQSTGRIVVVDGLWFRIDKELTVKINEATVENKDLSWKYVFDEQESTPGLVFQSAEIEFSAAVTLLEGSTGVWQAGFVQNVTKMDRTATYENGATICYRLKNGQAMRDGEDTELPFSYRSSNSEFVNLVPKEKADLEASDDPKMELPKAVGGSPLKSTGGVDELVTWLSLARPGQPKKTVLLGWVRWCVNWTSTKAESQYVYHDEVTHVDDGPVHDLRVELTENPQLGDGQVMPDYRKISANDYMVGQLTWSKLGKTWSFDDDDKAITEVTKEETGKTWFTDFDDDDKAITAETKEETDKTCSTAKPSRGFLGGHRKASAPGSASSGQSS